MTSLAHVRRRRTALVEAYEEMRDFDRLSLRLIEPLRVMRLVHCAAWIARRWEDASFPRTFSDFGSDRFWVGQVEALISNWKGQGEVSLPSGVKVSRISGRLTLSK